MGRKERVTDTIQRSIDTNIARHDNRDVRSLIGHDMA